MGRRTRSHMDLYVALTGCLAALLWAPLGPALVPAAAAAAFPPASGPLISSDGAGYCVIVHGGAAKCWGADGMGQAGEGHQHRFVDRPVVSELVGASEILGSAGLLDQSSYYQDYCGVVAGQVKCWGSGAWGQLGNGKSGVAYFQPVNAKDVSTARFLATDSLGFCAIVKLGHVRCWGYNGSYQLGDGRKAELSALPAAVKGVTGAWTLASDESGYCALVSGGKARCWGEAQEGVLGDGNDKSPAASSRPVTGLSRARALASDNDGYCALVKGGSVYCWGHNGHGELGNATASGDSLTPVKAHISGVKGLFSGNDAYCATVSGGSVKCWGNGGGGRLGDGSFKDSAVPMTVKGVSGARSVTGSLWGFCALVAGGKAKCWGMGTAGALGDGHAGGAAATAQNVKGLSNATELATDTTSWCALTSSGVFCWGSGVDGQLGNGRTGGRAVVAVKVKGV